MVTSFFQQRCSRYYLSSNRCSFFLFQNLFPKSYLQLSDLKILDLEHRGVQDPVSSNQTIGDNFSGKDFGIGRSYIDWKINNNANIFAGKMKLPWIRPGGGSLLWDGDLNPEGIVMFIS